MLQRQGPDDISASADTNAMATATLAAQRSPTPVPTVDCSAKAVTKFRRRRVPYASRTPTVVRTARRRLNKFIRCNDYMHHDESTARRRLHGSRT